MITEGRYQTTESKQTRWPFAKFSVTDTSGKTNGERFVCSTDTETKADQVALTLNLLARAAYVAEHLFQMIDQETWRAYGAEWQGQYEGDHHAEQTRLEIESWKTVSDG